MQLKKYAGKLLITCSISLLPLVGFTSGASGAAPGDAVQVGLLAGGQLSEQGESILSAYEQVLQEEGFLYQVVPQDDLAGYDAAGLRERFAALVVPELLNAAMTPAVAAAIDAYVRDGGGQVLLVFDPATQDAAGELNETPLLAGLAGVRYALPASGEEAATYQGYWYFPTAAKAREWGITPGKLNAENAVCSYGYGKTRFEHTRAANEGARVVAYDNNGGFLNPVITEKHYTSGGAAVYVNIPLGQCKLRSDDLTLRSALRTFLIRYAKAPRLVNSPGGKGGVVFNLHICSGAYFRALALMLSQGLFRQDTPMSIHITAGPDTYRLGDGAGFFAENRFKGRPVLNMLRHYGAIGSHGGWAHNFFAYNMDYLPSREAFRLIQWNTGALEAVTGKEVREYSDPGGAHPPWLNAYLAAQGINSCYYTGDSGSSPARAALDGLDESSGGQALWTFPISSYREYACFEEMERGGVPTGAVRAWLADLVDFAAAERTIRMVYSHPAETSYCLAAIRALEENVRAEQRGDRLVMAPMSWFADFLNRRAQTNWQVRQENGNYVVDLENPAGLEDITVAVYVGEDREYSVRGRNVQSVREDGWLYLTVTSDRQQKRIEVRPAA